MQPESTAQPTTPSNINQTPAQQPSLTEVPGFNPPQGLPINPPSGLPQAPKAGWGGLTAVMGTPKGMVIVAGGIIILSAIFVGILMTKGIVTIGE